MNKIKVLLAEDEKMLGDIIKESLETRNFSITLCRDGKEALEAYRSTAFDVLVLDVMMPELDGFSLAGTIRKTDSHTPVIFLTSRSRTEDVVEGFERGGNDYLKKPFSMEELIVRIKALLNRVNRPPGASAEAISLGRYTFNSRKQQLVLGEAITELTYRETQVLQLLAEHLNAVVERELLLKRIWGTNDFFSGRSLDVFITRLRKKLARDPAIQLMNLRGHGYKLCVG